MKDIIQTKNNENLERGQQSKWLVLAKNTKIEILAKPIREKEREERIG